MPPTFDEFTSMMVEDRVSAKSHRILFFNTLAFVICFAAWMLNGVLVTFLVDNGVFDWSPVEVGWLFGIPVLTGAIFRLPMGILTDKFGGRWVFGLLLLTCAIPMYFLSKANSFSMFAWMSFFYGFTGSGFAVGVANTSSWYPKRWQGTALGILGAGNAGASITTIFAPSLLNKLTSNGENLDAWRTLPQIYAAVLAVMGILFIVLTENKKVEYQKRTINQLLTPLKNMRVWRFGLYYFLVFGCFVAFSQWLVPYFVNVYSVSLVTAGFLSALFSFPSGVIRALGGWMSDKWGARKVMYGVLGSSLVISFLLIIPRMEIYSPGQGIMAEKSGTVEFVSDSLIRVDDTSYILEALESPNVSDDRNFIFPTKDSWQEPIVKVNDVVKKKQLLAKATTKISFQANMWVFVFFVVLIGIVWGIGKAAVYKHIPEYFPNEVGVVGGTVGVIGGLGGFFCPILFGYLLQGSGLWTSSWMLMLVISAVCLVWMHRVINNIMKKGAPHLAEDMEHKSRIN